jgi:hypothetical protein
MNKIGFFLMAVMMLAGCAEAVEVPVEEVPVVLGGDFSREDTVADSSSELSDDTGYGFAYHASNVLDLDYSTAWCSDPNDDDSWLRVKFPEQIDFAKVGTVGIVPGFARDEDIYSQNNRVKTLEMSYGGMGGIVREYEFEDRYGMQFFEFPQEEGGWSSVAFRVKDIYSGSKYDDTCISEIDFWSHWVEAEDAQAAYDYYEKNKKDQAVRPTVAKSSAWTIVGGTDACGRVDESLFDVKSVEDLYGKSYGDTESRYYSWKETGEDAYGFTGDEPNYFYDQPVYSVELNGVEAGDEVTFKWVHDMFIMQSPEYPMYLGADTVKVAACDDGSLYASSALLGERMIGAFSVGVYYGDRLISEDSYTMAQ